MCQYRYEEDVSSLYVRFRGVLKAAAMVYARRLENFGDYN